MPTTSISLLAQELEEQRPRYAPERLSKAEKDRLIQRAFYSMYRWYQDRSQAHRNWNPDRSFDWRHLGQNHSPEFMTVIEGFYAIEQYAPDYTTELVRLVRQSYGRSQYQLMWGSEEEKHSELWRNTLLFSRARTPEWIEQYTEDLRANTWTLPYSDPIKMILYTVFQERATQLNYLNLYKIAAGKSEKPQFAGDADPVLAQACGTIAKDEAAHFDFFLEGARLYLYYYPEETLKALIDVLATFWMPAMEFMPRVELFQKIVFEGGIFDGRQHARDVIKMGLKALGVESIKAVEKGIARMREIPNELGQMRSSVLFEGVNFFIVEEAVTRLFARFGKYEDEIGLSDVNPTQFLKNTWVAAESPA